MDSTVQSNTVTGTGPLSLNQSNVRVQPQNATPDASGTLPQASAPARMQPTDQVQVTRIASYGSNDPQRDIQEFCKEFCQHQGSDQINALLADLEAWATRANGVSPDKLPASLRNLPPELQRRLPELLQGMRVEKTFRTLFQCVQSENNRYAAMEILNLIKTVNSESPNLTPDALKQRVAALRGEMSFDAMNMFTTLGLEHHKFDGLMPALAARTAELQEIATRFDTRGNIEKSFKFSSNILNHVSSGFKTNDFLSLTSDQPVLQDTNDLDFSLTNAHSQNHKREAELQMVLASTYSIRPETGLGNDVNGIGTLLPLIEDFAPDAKDTFNDLIDFGSNTSMLSRVVTGKGPEFKDFHANLDIRKGNNAILMQMMLKSDKIEDYAPVLSKAWDAGSQQPLTPADIKKLNELGIGLHEGKLINTVTGQRLTGQDLKNINLIVTQLSQGNNQWGAVSGAQAATNLTATWAKSFLQESGLALQLEAEIRQGNERIDVLSQQAKASEQKINEATVRVQAAQKEYDQIVAQEADLRSRLAPFMRDGKLDVQLAVSQGKLAELNAILAEFHMTVDQQPNGQLAFRYGQHEWSQATFEANIDNVFESFNLRKLQAAANLRSANEDLGRQRSEGQRIADQLAQETQEQKRRLEQFKATMAGLDTSQIRARLQDPALRSQLSAEEIALLEDRLRQIEETQRNMPALITRTEETIQRGEKAKAELEQAIEASRPAFEKAAATLGALPPGLLPPVGRDEARELSKLANQLEFRLNLAPQPNQAEVAKLLADWHQSIEKATRALERALSQQVNARQAERTQETRFMERLRDSLQYHLQQLEGIDARQHQQALTLLQQNVQHVQELQLGKADF